MWLYPSFVLALMVCLSGTGRAAGEVFTVALEGIIGPATADIYTHAVQRAETARAQALVVRLDTPGGSTSPCV